MPSETQLLEALDKDTVDTSRWSGDKILAFGDYTPEEAR